MSYLSTRIQPCVDQHRPAAAPESPYPNPPPQRSYAPPPGPPPGWDLAFGVTPPSSLRTQQQESSRGNGPTTRTRILSHDEEIQRLFKVCSTAKGNAQLLRETIAYTKPEELKENELIEVRFDTAVYSISEFIQSFPYDRSSARDATNRKSSLLRRYHGRQWKQSNPVQGLPARRRRRKKSCWHSCSQPMKMFKKPSSL